MNYLFIYCFSGDEMDVDRDSLKDKRNSPSMASTTPSHSLPPTQDEDSRMSLVSEPEKTSKILFANLFIKYLLLDGLLTGFNFFFLGNFVPFAMGGNRGDHSAGNKTPSSPNSTNNVNFTQSNQNKKKMRMDVKDVFNNDEDDESAANAKKRKLVPLGKYGFFFI